MLILSFFLFSAFPAAMAQTPPVAAYECELMVVASALPEGGKTWKFSIDATPRNHGGEPRIFQEGEHQLEVLADTKWLGISWSKAGKKIAEGVFVLGDSIQSRVAILYDPSDSGDQASLGCHGAN